MTPFYYVPFNVHVHAMCNVQCTMCNVQYSIYMYVELFVLNSPAKRLTVLGDKSMSQLFIVNDNLAQFLLLVKIIQQIL